MKTVGIYPAANFERLHMLFAAISLFEPVRFQAVEDVRDSSVDALLLFEVPFAEIVSMAANRRVLAFERGISNSIQASNGPIRFENSLGLAHIFRGQELPDSRGASVLSSVPEGAEMLASKRSAPIWVRGNLQGGIVDLVAGELPTLDEKPYLYQYFQPGDCMNLLPLFHFVKELTGAFLVDKPPLRACFMFDDPNLHWPSFGYIKYGSLIESAKRHNYHVSFATVPLDAWFVHEPTAKLFRQQANRISLLVHGNNHTYRELAGTFNNGESLQMAAQSLQRIARLERRSGVAVSRVMAAPHGACNEQAAEALLNVGYEAACISRGSLMNTNASKSWSSITGLTPAEFLGQGLPIIPRFRITRFCQPEIILAAFLGQPIIPVGHHQDLADGYDMLVELATFINRLGSVVWTDLGTLIRSNYTFRQEGQTAYIELYSRHVRFELSPGLNRMVVRRPWLEHNSEAEPLVIIGPDRFRLDLLAGEMTSPIPIESTGLVEIFSPVTEVVDYLQVPCHAAGLWPISRRILTEGRDRFRGLLRYRHLG